MSNYNQSSDYGKKIIFQFLEKRMKEKGISRYRLSKMTEIPENTLSMNFNNNSEMSLVNFLKICGALELRPYLIPAEADETELNRIFFN